MAAQHAFAKTLKTLETASGKAGQFYSLPQLARQFPNVNRMPISMRIVLESVLRNCDGKKVTKEHVEQLTNWKPTAERSEEIPFVVARVVLQDFTGVPLLADLAAMRSAAARLGKNTNVFLASAELAAIASKLGKLPTVAEYHEAMGIINKDADSVYRYMNFDQIEEYAETAKGVTV